MQDVFDGDCKEELEGLYTKACWSELEEEVKMSLVTTMENSLRAVKLHVPPKRELLKRLKNFYSSRRTQELTKSDPHKKRKRKLELKANRLTYVS